LIGDFLIVEPATWVVVIAAILSGFFALNSFSLRSFSRARMESLFTGSKARSRLEWLESHRKPLQLTLSLCRSIANLVLVAGLLMAFGVAGDQAATILVQIALAGVIVAVVGVAIPHAWASYAGERVLRFTLPALIALRYLLWPVTLVMRSFDLPIRRLVGLPGDANENGDAAKQEILQAATEGRAEGAVDDEEVEMIESVMELGETQAVEIMTPRTDVFALSAEMNWKTAAEQIFDAGHTRVPIYTGDLDHIIGILYAKDLLQQVGAETLPEDLTALSRKPFFIPESKPLDDLLREFKARKVHMAIVLDEYGGTAGLVTIEDILEEIVGDISDEYDIDEEQQIRRISETTAEVDGRLHIDELNDEFDIDLPEDEDYDTVAGFVIAQLGRIPHPGESFTENNIEFVVLGADERKISRLRVRRIITPEGEE
jgi:CBS domain containing-hemolysin-like protein